MLYAERERERERESNIKLICYDGKYLNKIVLRNRSQIIILDKFLSLMQYGFRRVQLYHLYYVKGKAQIESKLFFNYYLIFALYVQFNFLNFGASPLIIHGIKAKLITSLIQLRLPYHHCRDIGLKSSSFVCFLGLWPNPRTKGCPRRRNLYQKRLGQ